MLRTPLKTCGAPSGSHLCRAEPAVAGDPETSAQRTSLRIREFGLRTNAQRFIASWPSGELQGAPLLACASVGDRGRDGLTLRRRRQSVALRSRRGSRRDIGAFAFDASPAQTYCTAKQNSLGCTPAISAQGAASASSPSPFLIQCSNQISDRVGFLSYGFQPLALAYQGGWKCVRAPNFRTPAQNSGGAPGGLDCSGVFILDFNAHVRSGAHAALQPGVIIYAQYWARDPAASFANNRSDAIRFGLGL